MLDARGENRILLDPGANEHLSPEDVEAAAPVIAEADVLITLLEISVDAAAAALRIARDNGVTTILNPAPARALTDWSNLGADLVTPNASEARSMLGLEPDAPGNAETLGRGLLELGFGSVVLTQGERGAVILAPGAHTKTQPAWPTKVVDSTGAGDAFSGTLAAALAAGSSLEDAVDVAAAAGALACTKLGVVPSLPHAAEVARLRESRR